MPPRTDCHPIRGPVMWPALSVAMRLCTLPGAFFQCIQEFRSFNLWDAKDVAAWEQRERERTACTR